MILYVQFLILIWFFTEAVVIDFRRGSVRGYSVVMNGIQANVFKAIPFARPPLGNLRFRRPEKPDNWTGTLDGTRYSPACLTNSTVTGFKPDRMSEDCLYLNVFADSRCSSTDPCPVIFLIHGGAFQGDSATMFNETHLLHKFATDRFILVITAYRIGILGLMDLGKELDNEPYNIAIYDMIAALEWTRDEIPLIGGNISQITMIGYSSSGAALAALLASPEVHQDLFQQVFISSGCPRLMPHYSESMSLAVLRWTECNISSDLRVQVECLRSKPSKDLTDAMKATTNDRWWHIGFQSDNYFFPSATLSGLKGYWKARPLMLVSSKREMQELEGRPLVHICMHYILIFGYFRPKTLAECVRHYTQINETKGSPFYNDIQHILYRDIQHAVNVMLASWNSRKNQSTYVGLFAQEHHDAHVGDLFYLIGFHYDRYIHTEVDGRMEEFYVKIVKRFFRGQEPGNGNSHLVFGWVNVLNLDWLPTDQEGRNYYFIAFGNSTGQAPYFVKDEVYNPDAVYFWLDYLRSVEAARKIDVSHGLPSIDVTGSMHQTEFVSLNKNGDRYTDDLNSPGNPEFDRLSTIHNSRPHPLQSIFLVILAFTCSIGAFAVVLMVIDVLRSGILFKPPSPIPREELGEDALLLGDLLDRRRQREDV